MMIIGIVARAISREPVRPFQRWGVMCCDNRACCEGIGGDHAMNQFVRNMRAAVEWNVHKNDDRSAIGNCETAVLAGRCLAANG